MKIAFVTPELDPLVRRTPLAEVAAALPKALKEVGSDSRVFLPYTEAVQTDKLTDLAVVGNVNAQDVEGKTSFRVHRLRVDRRHRIWRRAARAQELRQPDRSGDTDGE